MIHQSVMTSSLRIKILQIDKFSNFSCNIVITVKASIHDATLLHANVACNKVASCMLKFHATKVACNIFACNNVASCMVVFCMQQMLHETKLHRVCRVLHATMLHATCCMEIEHVLFSCNILHQNCINYYDNDNHYQKYDQTIKIDNRKSACFS